MSSEDPRLIDAHFKGTGDAHWQDDTNPTQTTGKPDRSAAPMPSLEDRWACIPDTRHTFPPKADHCFCGALRRPPVDVAEVTLFTPAKP